MNTPNIETVTILEKRGETPTKIAIKYTGRKRVQVIDDAELVPLVILFLGWRGLETGLTISSRGSMTKREIPRCDNCGKFLAMAGDNVRTIPHYGHLCLESESFVHVVCPTKIKDQEDDKGREN